MVGFVPKETEQTIKLDIGALRSQLSGAAYRSVLLEDVRDLLETYMLDRDALARFAGDAPLNTDLNPRVLFDAPKAAYENRRDLRWANLQRLIPLRTDFPLEILDGATAVLAQELEKRRDAVGLYLSGDLLRAENGNPRPLSMEFLDYYLRAYEADPSFRPAYSYLHAIAALQLEQASEIYRRILAVTPSDRNTLRNLELLQRAGGNR